MFKQPIATDSKKGLVLYRTPTGYQIFGENTYHYLWERTFLNGEKIQSEQSPDLDRVFETFNILSNSIY